MERRDLAAALHHLDHIAAPQRDRHRLELERILLRLIAEAEEAERIVLFLRRGRWDARLLN